MEKIRFTPDALKPIRIENGFYSKASILRADFDSILGNPLKADSRRFCWDFWHVRDQYRLLRTPAEFFFPKTHFQSFLNHLLQWGRRNLGCQMISHPWLSAYVNDCFQELHSDVPHGPWSFVFSLTPVRRTFNGGETIVSKPRLLRYFNEHDSGRSDENSDLFERIKPDFNRLVVFDPRYPHGVTRVNGVSDLLDARLVIHGWFTEPRPMIEGTLTAGQCLKSMDRIAIELLDHLGKTDLSGMLSIRIRIAPSGVISSIDVLTAHLISTLSGKVVSSAWLKQTLAGIKFHRFPKSSGTTLITLPLEARK